MSKVGSLCLVGTTGRYEDKIKQKSSVTWLLQGDA
jgi:hypothetical protein